MDRSNEQPVKPDRLLTTLEQLLAIDASTLEPALQCAADIVSEVLGADKVDVFLYDAATASLVARGTSDTPMGHKGREIGMDRLPLAGDGRSVSVFRSGQTHRSGRVDEDPDELVGITQGLGVLSQVIVPLDVGGEPRGVLAAVSAKPEFFSDADESFLQAVSRWTSLVMHRIELAEALMGQAEDRGRREGLGRLLAHLTPRQLEVAVLIANGYSNQQIAKRLVLTPGTVANHVAQALERLGVESRTHVAALVAEVGLHRLNDTDPSEWAH
jgi:DNA-binding CsgD family transcriptional regulator